MPSFERASNIAISGGQFSEIHGNVYLGHHPNAEALDATRKMAENDGSFNAYSPAEGTLKLPTLTKDLLLNITTIVTDASKRPTSGSCCFDLAWRLGLLPGQAVSDFMEYEQDIPLEKVVTRSACCCGRISRHGFIHLVSRFFQHVSTQETTGGSAVMIINTTIGRFKCYEIDDGTFVHFDGSTRSSEITEIVTTQDLDHILRAAQGQYLINDTASLHQTKWGMVEEERIPHVASGNFFGVSNAIMYMTKEKIATWKLLKDFGRMLLTCTMRYIDTLHEPESFCRLVDQHHTADFDPRSIKKETPPGALSLSLWMCRYMSERVIIQFEYELFIDVAKDCLHGLLKGHQHYRSPRVQADKMVSTSQDRFLRMFRTYRAQETRFMPGSNGGSDMEAIIETELQSLMQTTPNNIALVVYQAFVGLSVYWNAARMLARSREVPTDWIRFVSAEDDYIYLG